MFFYELFIGLRYLKSKKSQGIVSTNTALSVIIVFIGVFTLIVVLSVMNGFQSAIKDKILDIDSHITVTKVYGSFELAINNYRGLSKKIRALPEVVSAEPYIQSQGLMRVGTTILPIMIRGIGGYGAMPAEVKKFIIEGKKEFEHIPGVYLGKELADNEGLNVGDTVEIIVPRGRLTVSTGVEPGMTRYRIAGKFKTGYYDFDTKLIVLSLPLAQSMFEIGDVASGIGVKIRDVYKMDRVAQDINTIIGYDYLSKTAEQKNHNLFYALKLEKLLMMIILFLIIISACLMIMGTLVIVVMEKRRAIGILKSMGAAQNSIVVIFLMEGFLIGVLGSLIGVVLGVAASLNLDAIIKWIETAINTIGYRIYMFFELGLYYKISIVPTHIYYIEGLPSEVKPELVAFIAIMATFLSTIAAIFPAWNASKLEPVETIRYE
jgi:lipoprotein-releasing system permease protein